MSDLCTLSENIFRAHFPLFSGWNISLDDRQVNYRFSIALYHTIKRSFCRHSPRLQAFIPITTTLTHTVRHDWLVVLTPVRKITLDGAPHGRVATEGPPVATKEAHVTMEGHHLTTGGAARNSGKGPM